MSSAITIVQSWSSEYMAEVFLKPVFTAEDIINTYGIDPTVNRSKTIYLANDLKQVIQKKTTCGVQSTGSFDLGEKVIKTEPCAINLELCATEFYNTVFKKNLKRGSDIYDMSGTVLEKAMVDNVGQALRNDVFELCWFGDSTSNTPFYSTFDGWFKLLENNLPSANLETISTGPGGALGSGYALSLVRDLYQKGNALRSIPASERVFLVTDSIYNNLLETYENTAVDSGLKRLDEDKPLVFRGIPVQPQLNWDTSIAAQSLSNPHRVVYTKKENLIIGTDIRRPGSDAKLFLDEYYEKFFFKANFDLGVQYLFDEHVVYAR